MCTHINTYTHIPSNAHTPERTLTKTHTLTHTYMNPYLHGHTHTYTYSRDHTYIQGNQNVASTAVKTILKLPGVKDPTLKSVVLRRLNLQG